MEILLEHLIWGGTLLRRNCSYTTNQPQLVNKIELLGHDDGDIIISVEFLSELQAKVFEQKLKDQNLNVDRHFHFKKAVKTTCQDPVQLTAFLKSLIKEDEHVREILTDICQSLNISASLGSTLEDLKKKSVNEACDLAIEAQSNKSYELIYELLSYYLAQSFLPREQREMNVSFYDLYALANAISIGNPYFSVAQDRCVEILMRQESNLSPKEQKDEAQPLDEEEELANDVYLQRLELKFTHAMKGTQQNLTDMFYNELCGYGLGLPPKVKNIKGDPETLIPLAKVIRDAQPVLQEHANSTTGLYGFFPRENASPSSKASGVKRLEELESKKAPIPDHVNNVQSISERSGEMDPGARAIQKALHGVELPKLHFS